MSFHWNPPPHRSLKINVHGTFSAITLANGNNSGIGAVYRTHAGALKHLTIGTLDNLSPLGNQLWAIYAPMRRAFLLGYKSVIIETDNHQAYKVIDEYQGGARASIYDILDQIDNLRRNKTWVCSIAFIYPARNRVARYSAKLGMEVSDVLYTFDRPVAGVEELLDWDMGLGVDHPSFSDVHLMNEAQDPVNFNVGLTLADNVDNLGLGQADAPIQVVIDREEGENLEGVLESVIHSFNNITDELLFANESPLPGLD